MGHPSGLPSCGHCRCRGSSPSSKTHGPILQHSEVLRTCSVAPAGRVSSPHVRVCISPLSSRVPGRCALLDLPVVVSEAAVSGCRADHIGSSVLSLTQRCKGLVRGSHMSRTQPTSLCLGPATHHIHTMLLVPGLDNMAFALSLTTQDLTDPHHTPVAAALPAWRGSGCALTPALQSALSPP